MIPPASMDRSVRASALLVVLWCIAVMVTVLVIAATTVEQEMNNVSGRIARDRARQLALAGLAIAENPAVKPGDPILNQDFGNGERIQVQITSEETRLNLNVWLADDRQPSLVALFRLWGMERRDAERLVYAMADWIDGDSLKRMQGAEVRDYDLLNRPYNRPFVSLDEVRLVRDFGILERVRPDWRSRLSIRGQGNLDLMGAPSDLIIGITGCSPESVALWIRDRWGRDGLRYSDDDPVNQTLEQALGQLGIGPNNGVSQWLTIQGPTRRLQSVGFKGDYVHIVSLVISGGNGGGGGESGQPGGGGAGAGQGNLLWKDERSGTVEALLRSGGAEGQF
jgi:hypothetical protein